MMNIEKMSIIKKMVQPDNFLSNFVIFGTLMFLVMLILGLLDLTSNVKKQIKIPVHILLITIGVSVVGFMSFSMIAVAKNQDIGYISIDKNFELQDIKYDDRNKIDFGIINLKSEAYEVELPREIHAKQGDTLNINSNGNSLIIDNDRNKIYMKDYYDTDKIMKLETK